MELEKTVLDSRAGTAERKPRADFLLGVSGARPASLGISEGLVAGWEMLVLSGIGWTASASEVPFVPSADFTFL